MKRIYYILLGAVLILGSLTIVENGKEATSLKNYFSAQNIELNGLNNYTVQEKNTKSLNGFIMKDVSAKKGENRLEVKLLIDVSNSFAKEYLKQKRQKLSSVYSTTPAPYGAIPNRETECTDNKSSVNRTIKTTDKQNSTIYEVFIGESGEFACAEEDAEYRKKIFVSYCPESKTIIESELYKPVNSSRSDPIFKCSS